MQKLSIYKPNGKNQGAAISLSFRDDAMLMSIVRQKTWNPETKKGTFYNGKDKEHSLAMKFNHFEAGEILEAVNSRRAEKFFHKFGEKQTTISFRPWDRPIKTEDGELVDRSFGLSVSQGGVNPFKIPFTGGEMQTICAFLLKYLLTCFEKDSWVPKVASETAEAPED